MKTPHYKPGDHYPEWEKLTPFEDKPASEHGVKKGDLLVVVGEHDRLRRGKVISLLRDEFSRLPFVDTGELPDYYCCHMQNLAKLPQLGKPQMRVVQKAKYKHDDCDAVHSEDGVEFEGKLYTPEELQERSKLFRRLYERQKKLTF